MRVRIDVVRLAWKAGAPRDQGGLFEDKYIADRSKNGGKGTLSEARERAYTEKDRPRGHHGG